MEKNQFIKVKLSAYHYDVLDKMVSEIISLVSKVGGYYQGPIPMPTKTKKFLVIRGPHIDKKSREAFYLSIHSRVIYIKSDSRVMQEIKNVNISPEIGVQIKMLDS